MEVMRSRTNTPAINIIGKCPACYVIWIEASCRDRECMAIILMNRKTIFFFFFGALIKRVFFHASCLTCALVCGH